MSKTKRVVFNFDDRSFENLDKMTKQGRYSSMGSAVKDALQINNALQGQAEQGYTEVVVRNPKTNKERVLIIPTLSVNSGSDEGED